jgi:hypothetical protein
MCDEDALWHRTIHGNYINRLVWEWQYRLQRILNIDR